MRQIFYCKSYCSLNMFRAPLCPSSGAQDLYRWLLPVVLGALVYRSLVWCGAVVCVSGLRDVSVGLVWGCGLCVRFAGCFCWSGVGLWVVCPVCGMSYTQSQLLTVQHGTASLLLTRVTWYSLPFVNSATWCSLPFFDTCNMVQPLCC